MASCYEQEKIDEVIGYLMDNNSLNPSLPNGEPTMETSDWRTQMPPDSRPKIVSKITETLKKHLPFSGPEGHNELRNIAVRFEERIYSEALNQNDYLRKISMKMLTMEAKSQITAEHVMDNNSWSPSLPNREPTIETGDWRTELSRQKIVDKIMETLEKRFSFSGPEGLKELRRFAAKFEEKTFDGALNQTDYLHKISMKMMTMETKGLLLN